jgi:hypothetical protein
MEFSQLILEQLSLVIRKYNLQVVEQRKEYIQFESEHLTIILSHNPLENSNTLWIGKITDKRYAVEIDNKILKLFFNSDLKLSQVPFEVFVKNLVLFFENEGKPLLIGDINTISKLEEFDLERSRIYTQEILDKQNLIAINKAWDKGNYREFIKLLDQVDKDKLPSSYQLKYKIAHRKV